MISNDELTHFSSSGCSTRSSVCSQSQSRETKFPNTFATLSLVSYHFEVSQQQILFNSIFVDKEQEADFEPQAEEDSLGVLGEETDGGAGGERAMSTIRTGGNKALTHTNSINTGLSSGLQGSRVPTHGVVTSHEEELGACLDNIAVWGIDVFRIGDLSSNRPLTAVTYRVFQERELLSVFKIPASNLVALLLTLEDHYLKVSSSFYIFCTLIYVSYSSLFTNSTVLFLSIYILTTSGSSLSQQHPRG